MWIYIYIAAYHLDYDRRLLWSSSLRWVSNQHNPHVCWWKRVFLSLKPWFFLPPTVGWLKPRCKACQNHPCKSRCINKGFINFLKSTIMNHPQKPAFCDKSSYHIYHICDESSTKTSHNPYIIQFPQSSPPGAAQPTSPSASYWLWAISRAVETWGWQGSAAALCAWRWRCQVGNVTG